MLENNSFLVVITIINIIFSAFISFSETSILSSNKNKILLKKNKKLASFALKLLAQKDRVITVILIINTLANVIVSVFITTLTMKFFGSKSLFIASFFSTILLLIFGEIFPKILAMKNPNKYVLLISPVILLLLKLFYPIVLLIEGCLKIVFFIFGLKNLPTIPKFSKEVEDLVKAYKLEIREGCENFQEEEREIKYLKMIHSISNLDKITVEQVMKHRLNVFYIDLDDDIEEIRKSIVNSKHSRIVICDKDIDNIIGILNVKDILKEFQVDSCLQITKEKIKEISQKPVFVFENTQLLSQLENFKKENKHFGIVVDEYSVMIGIITLSDILEEIIGTIYDEYDTHKQHIKKINESQYIISGSLPIHEFVNEIGIEIKDYEEYTTLAAFLIDKFGYIPKNKEEIKIENYKFKILNVKNNKIDKIQMLIEEEE